MPAVICGSPRSSPPRLDEDALGEPDRLAAVAVGDHAVVVLVRALDLGLVAIRDEVVVERLEAIHRRLQLGAPCVGLLDGLCHHPLDMRRAVVRLVAGELERAGLGDRPRERIHVGIGNRGVPAGLLPRQGAVDAFERPAADLELEPDRTANPTLCATLLDDVGQLVSEEMLARWCGEVGEATTEEHVGTRRERGRTEGSAEFVGTVARVHPHGAEIGAQRTLEPSAEPRRHGHPATPVAVDPIARVGVELSTVRSDR